MGYVDRTTGGTTELRVHGVSGTPPEATLDHPHTERVAGDADAGFYRRVWESAAGAQDAPPGGDAEDGRHGTHVDRLEAYSWGGLTSGGWSRALYLLLLPFLLLNVGFFATPGAPAKEGESPGALRRTSELLQRLLALSLTMTMVLAMIEVSIDIVGWQCGRATATCGTGPLGVPDWSWLREPGPRLAASALVPIGVVLVLWWLARRTWASAEAVAPPKAAATPGVQVSPLEDRRFWNGGEAVANLRAFHISAALALVGVAVAAPSIVAPGGGISAFWSSGPVVQRVVAMVLVVVLVASVVGVATWNLAERRAPDADADADATPPQPVGGWRTALPTATLALALVAAVATAAVGAPPAARPASILPWLTWAINAVFWSQVALVALFAVVTAVQARSLPRPAPVALTTSGSGGAVVTSPAWRGLAAPVFALLGWIVGSGFAAALALRIADTVGTPIAAVDAVSAATRKATSGETGPYAGKQILLPVGYFWASAAAAVSLGVVLVIGVVMVVRVMNNVGRMRPVVDEQYDAGVGADDERVGQIARVWAIAQAPNLARVLAAFLVSGVAVVLVLGLAGYAWDEQWIVNHGWAGLLLVGNLVMTLAVAGLLWAGRQAYSNQRFRRTIGVLWDIGTFWPRATHPLAPPSYGERAVPDLLYRIEGLTRLDGPDAGREDLVVLSCHSQGTVIGAAVVAASRYQALARTAFFTYGNPLRRIYARFFPAYFGIEQLDRLGRLLVTGSGDDDRAMQQAAGLTRARTGGTDSDAGERAAWPWRSLQRPSDPIGGPVFVDAAPAAAPPPDGTEPLSRDVDVTLLDPTFHRSRGDRTWPAALGHSDYDRDPLYPAARADVIVLRRRPGAAAPAPAGLPPAPRQDEPVTP